MNKFVKGLILTLVIATPVAMTVSDAQAATAKPTATTKAGKVTRHKMHKHHHRSTTAKAHK